MLTTCARLQPGCPMRSVNAPGGNGSPSSCPASDDPSPPLALQPPPHTNTLSRLNPLNWMFPDISQAPAPGQTVRLPTSRDPSSIPKGDASGENWQYPSPQQMYNALLRKGHTDTDASAVEDMVHVHNVLNEGAWAEIIEWERRFAGGLKRGWTVSRRGEGNSDLELRRVEAQERATVRRKMKEVREGLPDDGESPLVMAPPKLLRFQGRPGEITPEAAMLLALGKLWPAPYR